VRRRWSFFHVSGVLGFVAIGRVAAAQDIPVTWSAVHVPSVAAGGTARITLTAAIADGWHLYSLTQPAGGPVPTRIPLAQSQLFALADSVQGVPPQREFDPNFGIEVETYSGSTPFLVPVKVMPEAKPGVDTVAIKARYQVCNATTCLPVRVETVVVPVTVTRASAAKAAHGPA